MHPFDYDTGIRRVNFLNYFFKGGADKFDIMKTLKEEGITEREEELATLKHSILRNAWKSLIGATRFKDNADIKLLLKDMVKATGTDLINDKDLKGNSALGILLSSSYVSKKRVAITLSGLYSKLKEMYDWDIT